MLIAVFAALAVYVLTNVMPTQRQMLVPPLATICAFVGASLLGAIQFPSQALATLGEDVVWVLLALWLALRPGIAPTVALLALSVLEFLGAGLRLSSPGADPMKFAMVGTVIIQVIFVVLLIRGYLKWRKRPADDLADVFE